MKKVAIVVSVIALGLVALLVVDSLSDYLVDIYYPTSACGSSGSSIEATNIECTCSGLKLSKSVLGYTNSICIGKRTSITCWNRNNPNRIKQLVACPG